jgi:predicted NUDIX family NTP pyrophosphohydrolase
MGRSNPFGLALDGNRISYGIIFSGGTSIFRASAGVQRVLYVGFVDAVPGHPVRPAWARHDNGIHE